MSSALKCLAAMVRAYAHHPDPRVAAANVISLLVASNQPFYPLYLFWLVSADITAAWFTFLSTPFFLAVPALAQLAQRTTGSVLFTFAPRTTLLAAMHTVGKAFPKSDRSPAIVPVAEGELRERLARLQGWSIGRTQRISSGFYTSQALELVRHG